MSQYEKKTQTLQFNRQAEIGADKQAKNSTTPLLKGSYEDTSIFNSICMFSEITS